MRIKRKGRRSPYLTYKFSEVSRHFRIGERGSESLREGLLKTASLHRSIFDCVIVTSVLFLIVLCLLQVQSILVTNRPRVPGD